MLAPADRGIVPWTHRRSMQIANAREGFPSEFLSWSKMTGGHNIRLSFFTASARGLSLLTLGTD